MFDISQKDMANRTSVYVENDGKVNPRHINHVALRTMHPDDMAEFYRDVFELAPSNVKKRADDTNHYLTDGHMTLVIMPWDITDYDGTGIITAGMDHIGFKVESVDAFKADVERIAGDNPRLAPAPVAHRRGRRGARQAVRAQLRHGPAPARRPRRHPDRRDAGLRAQGGTQKQGGEPCGAGSRLRSRRSSLLSGTASADPIAEFYKGKNINWILSAGAGGGYASYAHAFAPFLSAHIPGKPHIVVQNMPGAGGIRAMIYLNSVAPKDGTTIGLVHSSVPFAPLYGTRGANFDPRADELDRQHHRRPSASACPGRSPGSPSGSTCSSASSSSAAPAPARRWKPCRRCSSKLFGAKIKVISGYKGGNDVYLAMERGEVHGRCGGLVSSIKSTRPDWFPEKKIAVPIQIALAARSGIPRQSRR